MWVFSTSESFLYQYLGEWPRLPSTAGIGRAQFHRARSASKEGTWPLPAFADVLSQILKALVWVTIGVELSGPLLNLGGRPRR